MAQSFPTSLPKVWDYDSVFPHPEGTHFEFKHTINLIVDISQYKEKWSTIICGLLNSGGGWFIIGIEDKEHLVKGIEASRKVVDHFQLWVDSLYRSLILTDGTTLDPQNTHLKVFTWTVQEPLSSSNTTTVHKMLLALKCIPTIRKKNPDMRYQSIGGQIYYRLNASTHCVHGEPVLRQSQVYQRDKENAKTIQEFQDELRKKENLLITKELEKRKLQSLLDQEKHQSSLRVQNAIQETSEILYQYYHTQHQPPTNSNSNSNSNTEEEDKRGDIEQGRRTLIQKQKADRSAVRHRLCGFIQCSIFTICCIGATTIYALTGFPSGTF